MVGHRPQWTTVMGGGLVMAGLALFMVVFFTMLPILRDPASAYTRWFPVAGSDAAPELAVDTTAGPVAGFTWEAIAVDTDPPVYRVRFVAAGTAGAAEISGWLWDFGDGSGGREERAVHDYAGYGAYVVTLTVIDEAGMSDTVRGEIAVPGIDETRGATGQINALNAIDLKGSLESAVGDVGADIKASLDGAVGSIGASVRGAVVVFLFALAALATTIVAWRVARLGVMILNGPTPSPQPSRRHADYGESRQLEPV